jgi:CRP/FNR family cyclic AMP-dependent transcriptional regulator
MAISHLAKVEDKLLVALWHLASTWGRVTPQGVYVPLALTHTVLGEVVGAYRPSVTVAMQRLHDRGEVTRTSEGGYLLTGDPGDWSRQG